MDVGTLPTKEEYMQTLFGDHWQTSVLGFMAGLFTYLQGALASGTALPTNAQGWLQFGVAALMALLGRHAADASPTAPKA